MSIVGVFASRTAALLGGSEQSVNESLIELATFFYKIDRRVSLEEQKYVHDLLKTIEWRSPKSIQSYQRDCIANINRVIEKSEEEISIYLSELMQKLSDHGAADKAKLLAREISDADGEIADDEVKYLDLVMAFE